MSIVNPLFGARCHAAMIGILFCNFLFVLGNAESPAADNTPNTIPVRVLILRPYGFNNKEITVEKGDLILTVINDAMFNKDIDLYVEKDGQGRNAQDKSTKGKHSQWRSVLNLTPGIYWLREASHPNWYCKITVLPPGKSH